MKEDEKQISIKIKNDNCLIYLNNNESSLLDKTKKINKEELFNDDDIKEFSYSVSDNYSNKRKQNLKKNFNSIDKTDYEISNISIFNSNIKQEGTNIKTPLYEKSNESTSNNKNSKRKDNNNLNFLETLKTKNLVIKKLKFDSAECDTIQETDTIKKLYIKQQDKNEENEENLFTENINKNLNKQFFLESGNENIDNDKKIDIREKSSIQLMMNNKNIINIKNELVSTIKYKQECVEKYNNQLKKSKSKPVIHNNTFDIKCRSISRDKKENTCIIFTKPEQKKIKEKKIIIKNKNSNKKILAKNNSNSFNALYNKNLMKNNYAYIKKKVPSKKPFVNINNSKFLNYNSFNSKTVKKQPSHFSFDSNIILNQNYIDKKLLSPDLNNYRINDKFYFTYNNFNSNCLCSCSSTNNIFIKKNFLAYNNYFNHINQMVNEKQLYYK